MGTLNYKIAYLTLKEFIEEQHTRALARKIEFAKRAELAHLQEDVAFRDTNHLCELFEHETVQAFESVLTCIRGIEQHDDSDEYDDLPDGYDEFDENDEVHGVACTCEECSQIYPERVFEA